MPQFFVFQLSLSYVSCRVDFNGRQCTNFTADDIDKKQNDNTKRLSQRAHDVHRWKVELEQAIRAMDDEINTLEVQRQRLKTAVGVLRMPESIAGECLARRTARLERDLVRDKAEEELIKVHLLKLNARHPDVLLLLLLLLLLFIIKVQFNDDASFLRCDAVSLIEQFPVLSRQYSPPNIRNYALSDTL